MGAYSLRIRYLRIKEIFVESDLKSDLDGSIILSNKNGEIVMNVIPLSLLSLNFVIYCEINIFTICWKLCSYIIWKFIIRF